MVDEIFRAARRRLSSARMFRSGRHRGLPLFSPALEFLRLFGFAFAFLLLVVIVMAA